jgi:hypothetical protein
MYGACASGGIEVVKGGSSVTDYLIYGSLTPCFTLSCMPTGTRAHQGSRYFHQIELVFPPVGGLYPINISIAPGFPVKLVPIAG